MDLLGTHFVGSIPHYIILRIVLYLCQPGYPYTPVTGDNSYAIHTAIPSYRRRHRLCPGPQPFSATVRRSSGGTLPSLLALDITALP